jgi:transposase
MNYFNIHNNNKNNINGFNINKIFVRSLLLHYYDRGIKEGDVYEEMTRIYGPEAICIGTVYKWFERFKKGDRNLGDRLRTGKKQKFTNEYLIQVVKDNPQLNMKELSKLTGTSISTISRRLTQVDDNRANYQLKKLLKGASKKVGKKNNVEKIAVEGTEMVDKTNENVELTVATMDYYNSNDPVSSQYTTFYEKV